MRLRTRLLRGQFVDLVPETASAGDSFRSAQVRFDAVVYPIALMVGLCLLGLTTEVVGVVPGGRMSRRLK